MKTQKEQQNLMEEYSDLFKMGVNTSKVIKDLIEIGRNQAISEFKEKLIKRIAPDRLHRKWNEDVLEIIEKIVQEIK
jgi:hypothetical protein